MKMSSRFAALALSTGLGAAAVLTAPEASADTLHARSSARAGDYLPVEELGYEYILDTTGSGDARLALRVTLHNASATNQDVSLALALPRKSEVIGTRIKRGGGDWADAVTTVNRGTKGRRDQGNIYVRRIGPSQDGGLPRADVVGFDLSSGETVQVELQLEVFPELQGDRWHLDLPRRNAKVPNLSRERRVVVKADGRPEFWVDDVSNLGAKYMTSRTRDTVTLAWPADIRGGSGLVAELDTMDGPGKQGGDFRLTLRLGEESYELNEGDSVSYAAHTTMEYRNESDGECEILLLSDSSQASG